VKVKGANLLHRMLVPGIGVSSRGEKTLVVVLMHESIHGFLVKQHVQGSVKQIVRDKEKPHTEEKERRARGG
jgi:hypothetical protein